PTHEEIGERVGLDAERVEALLSYNDLPISLDLPLSREPGNFMTIGDTIEDDRPGPEEQALAGGYDGTYEELYRLIDQLPRRERTAIHLRYGLLGEEPRNINEIAPKLGVPVNVASRIIAKAAERLREPPPQRESPQRPR